MKYTYLNVFYTVAKLQNISKAAKELDVTQPAVSRIILNIEKEYNTQLFFRSKNGVTLTRDGQKLFEMIKNPLIELEKISTSIDNRHLDEITIHVGATSTALYCFLFKKLEEIKKLFPRVNFRIYSNSSKKLLEMVEKGSIDFAFITTPFEGGEELEIYNIAKLNDILIAPISYQDEIKGQVSIKSLTKYKFVLLSKEMQFRQYVDDFFTKHGVSISPSYETDSSSILMPFVENGLGLTIIPDEMAFKAIEEKKCFQVNLKEKLPPRYIAFAIKKDKNHRSVIFEIKQKLIER